MNAYTYWKNDIPFHANIYEILFFFAITLTSKAGIVHPEGPLKVAPSVT